MKKKKKAKKSKSLYVRSFIFPKYAHDGTCIPLDTVDSFYMYFHYKKYDVFHHKSLAMRLGYGCSKYTKEEEEEMDRDFEERLKEVGDEGEWRIKFLRPGHKERFWYYDTKEQVVAEMDRLEAGLSGINGSREKEKET